MERNNVLILNSKRHSRDAAYTEPEKTQVWVSRLGLMYLFLIALIVLPVSSIQADGLFDFQMKLAKKGNAEAEFKVGEMYETGFGVKQNMEQAELWINKAAAQGHETAGFKLLYWDLQKNGMKGGNQAKYNALLDKAKAENGQAMYYVGKMHAHGVGVKQNYDTALEWLNKATFLGIVEAEREAITVKDNQQKSLAAARKAEQRNQALEKAKKEAAKKEAAEKEAAEKEKKRKRLIAENKKKQEEQKRLKAEQLAREKQARVAEAEQTAQQQEAEKAKQREAEQARMMAEQQAAEKEQKRQALLKKRAEDEKRKAEFESDPCSGKSARFLSTCR